MENKLLQALQAAGVDTETALARFLGNAALYERFLIKFPKDPSFAQIGPALEAEDWDSALTAAHTLKGVAGNLGMTALFQTSGQVVDLIRAGKYEEARAAYSTLQASYMAVSRLLEQESSR